MYVNNRNNKKKKKNNKKKKMSRISGFKDNYNPCCQITEFVILGKPRELYCTIEEEIESSIFGCTETKKFYSKEAYDQYILYKKEKEEEKNKKAQSRIDARMKQGCIYIVRGNRQSYDIIDININYIKHY